MVQDVRPRYLKLKVRPGSLDAVGRRHTTGEHPEAMIGELGGRKIASGDGNGQLVTGVIRRYGLQQEGLSSHLPCPLETAQQR